MSDERAGVVLGGAELRRRAMLRAGGGNGLSPIVSHGRSHKASRACTATADQSAVTAMH